jgi:hypothetical protein
MGEIERRFKEWISDKPEEIKKSAGKFPVGSTFDIRGTLHHLIGFTESGDLIVSEIDPFEDYDGAIAGKKYVCADHFQEESCCGEDCVRGEATEH